MITYKTNSYIYSFGVKGLTTTFQSSLDLTISDDITAHDILKYILKSAQNDVVKELGADFKDAEIKFIFITLANIK